MAYDYDKYFEPEIELMPRSDIEKLQANKLKQSLPNILANSALYKQVWGNAGISAADINSLEDFKAKAPFISKDAIREYRDANNDPYGGIMIVGDEAITAVGFTSGTTGDPTPVPIGRVSSNEIQQFRDIWHIGARPGDYITHFLFTFRGGQARNNWHNGAGFIPLYAPHDPAEIPYIIGYIKEYRPTVIYMLSTPMLIGFEKYFEASGEDPKEVFSSVKGAYFGGEPLSPRFAALTKEWGLEIFEYSSLGDVTGTTECNQHNGMHGWEDLAIIENLDDDGNPVPDGEVGELVVTALEDPIAPLIRYRTEDLVKLDRSVCGCGRTHVRFWPIGRKGDRTIVNGVSILPRAIQILVEKNYECRACLFQIIRPEPVMDILRLRVGHNPQATKDIAELKSRLEAQLNDEFNVPVEVELVSDDDLLKLGPPQKIPRVTKK